MWSKSATLAAVVLVVTMSALRADLPMAKNPPRVELSANRLRSTKVAGGDWDDRLQKVQIEAAVKNLDFNHPVNGLKLHYWVFAESLLDHKELLVIDSGTADVNLTNEPEGREMHHQGELVTLRWDDTDAIFGERYKGWLLVLVNDKNEVVAVKANTSLWEQNFQRAFALKTKSWCNLTLQPIKKSN